MNPHKFCDSWTFPSPPANFHSSWETSQYLPHGSAHRHKHSQQYQRDFGKPADLSTNTFLSIRSQTCGLESTWTVKKLNDLTLNMAVKDLWLHLGNDDSNDLSVSNIDQSLMLQSGVNGWDADLTWIALTKDFTWLDTEQPVSWPAQERNDWSRNRKQLLDELLWYDVQTCAFPSGGIVITSSLNLPPSSGEHF